MAKIITCLNTWINSKCCGSDSQEYIHGVRIKDGVSVIATHRYPFNIKLGRSALIITENKQEFHYKLADFGQSYAQIKALLITCQHHGTLIRKKVEYIVNNGAQQTFLTPITGNESYIGGSEYYEVYVNGQQVSEGTDPYQFIIVNGQPFFTVALPDLTPLDPIIVSITYWVNA